MVPGRHKKISFSTTDKHLSAYISKSNIYMCSHSVILKDAIKRLGCEKDVGGDNCFMALQLYGPGK